MARGDRSRQARPRSAGTGERTPEERERDRLERERRRAEREGRQAPVVPPPLEEEPPGDAGEAPDHAAGGVPAADDPAARDAASLHGERLPVDASVEEQPLAQEQPLVQEEPLVEEQPQVQEEPLVEEHVAHGEPAFEEQPAAQEEPVVHQEPVVQQQPVVEEPVAHPEPAVHRDPAGDVEPAVHEQAVAHEAPSPEEELEARGGSVAGEAAHPDAAGTTGAALELGAAAQPGTPGRGEGARQGEGRLPPPPPRIGAGEGAREAEGRLPPPPPRIGAASSGGDRGRPSKARVGALLALVAAAIAVGLLLYALLHKSSAKPVASPDVIKVLIPEGKTRAQIEQIAAKAGLRGSYRVASRSSPLLEPAAYGAPAGTPDLEGFLFPATYDEFEGALASRLVADQLVAFKENFGPKLEGAARALHETPYQLLIVASMLEREAQIPSDRPKIAAVIYNRLRAGMPLGVDATIYYAIELESGVATYTHELTEAQLHIDSPYNTRTHVGLPPTPISNPGLAAMEAAAHPAKVPYLYYVSGADGCGEMVFSTTAAAFEANVAAYREALARNGGHLPKCKK